MSDRLPPGLGPFFALTTLLHGAAVISRFDLIQAALPPVVHAALLCGQLPLLLLEAYFLDRLLETPAAGPTMPLWMRVPAGPVRSAFALALTYIGLFTLQTWDLSLGGFDPTAPAVWPPAQRLAWFVGFAVVLTFPAYLAAMSTLVPVLRAIVRPLRALPASIAVIVATLLGGGVGLAALALVDINEGALFAELAALKGAIEAEPIGALLLTAALPALGGGVGLVRDRYVRRRRQAAPPRPRIAGDVEDERDDEDDSGRE